MIRIVRLQTDVDDRVLARCQRDLPPAERIAVPQGRRGNAARHRLVARAVLRRLLGRQLGLRAIDVPLRRQPAGKPELAVQGHGLAPLHFSLSYAGGQALLALADAPVGVDIETHVPDDVRQLALQVCSGQELARLDDCADDAHAFLDIWSAKEAALKMIGVGLRHDPRGLTVPAARQTFQPLSMPLPLAVSGPCSVASWRPDDAAHAALCIAAPPDGLCITHEDYEH